MSEIVELNSTAPVNIVEVDGLATSLISKINGADYPVTSNRISVTIPAADVSAALTNFPLLVILNDTDSAELFQALTDASLDGIAAAKKLFIMEDDDTPMPAEVESADIPGGQIVLYTLVPAVSSSVDTVFYIEWNTATADNANMGLAGTAVAQSIWDSNFKAVYHMNNDPTGGTDCIIDSTVNANHGTPYGLWFDYYLVTGPSGAAIYFLGQADKHIRIDKSDSLDLMSDEITMEVLVDPDSNTSQGVVARGNGGAVAGNIALWGYGTGSGWYVGLNDQAAQAQGEPHTFAWHTIAGRYDKTTLDIIVDGSVVDTDAYTASITADDDQWRIGWFYSNSNEFQGNIGEVRLSDIDRSDAWIDVTGQSLQGTLLTVSSPI